MFVSTSLSDLFETAKDTEVQQSIKLTLWVSLAATIIFSLAAIPLAALTAWVATRALTNQRLLLAGMAPLLLLQALHTAAWDEGLVDLVRLYVTPHVLGDLAVRFLPGRRLPPTLLAQQRVQPLGPDVLVEGYVHGPY